MKTISKFKLMAAFGLSFALLSNDSCNSSKEFDNTNECLTLSEENSWMISEANIIDNQNNAVEFIDESLQQSQTSSIHAVSKYVVNFEIGAPKTYYLFKYEIYQVETSPEQINDLWPTALLYDCMGNKLSSVVTFDFSSINYTIEQIEGDKVVAQTLNDILVL